MRSSLKRVKGDRKLCTRMCLLIGDSQETPDSIKVNKKEKDIHSEPIDVSNTESLESGTDLSISDASDIPDLWVPIPAPRCILRNVPVTTPTPSNVVSLDRSDSSDSVLSLSNDVISAGPERSISDISDTEVGNVDTESVSENISEHGSESNNFGIEFSERPAEVSADAVESCNSHIEFSEEPAEVSADVIDNLGTDSEVGEVSSNFTPTPAPRRSNRVRTQKHLDPKFVYNFAQPSSNPDRNMAAKVDILKKVFSLF